MKKVVLLIITVISVLNANAQGIDSLQVQSAITIDSLVLRLEKLQHDYDFMSCDYELYQLQMGLNNLSQDIEISTNGVLIDIYNNRYDRELYTVFSDSYDASCALYDSLKKKYESVKTLVMLKMLVSNFSDSELDVIYSYFDAINNSAAKVDSALKYYNASIKAYKGRK